jgi:hypothetical protein
VSAYEHDDRVHAHPDGTTMVFADDGTEYNVAPMRIGWDVTPGRYGVFDVEGTFLGNAGPFDEVVYSLIGDPQ